MAVETKDKQVAGQEDDGTKLLRYMADGTLLDFFIKYLKQNSGSRRYSPSKNISIDKS